MILSTDSIFLTDDLEGLRVCRETRVENSATMTVIYCSAGTFDVDYQGMHVHVGQHDLFVRLPGHDNQLGMYTASPDFKHKQITIDAAIFEQIMYDHMRVEPDWYAKREYIRYHPVFRLNAPSRDFFNTYFHLIELQLKDRPSAYRNQILMSVAKAATMEMLNYLDKLSVLGGGKATRLSVNQSDYTFHEFTKQLQEHPHEREVQWHAKQLNITPKYLSEICKERSGKSASQWIADVTVAELRHLLRDTTLPIREIAKIMEFPNASFFCQYTKKHTGLTPNHFRKEKKA